jgi:hypothetical protein
MDNELIYGWVRCKRASGHNQPKDKPKSAVLSLCFLFVIGLLPSGSADEMSCGWSSLLACCLWRSALITHNQKRRKAAQFSHFPPRFIEEFHVDWCCCSLFLCGAVRQLPPLTHKEKNNPINTHSSYAAWGAKAAANEINSIFPLGRED